MDVISLTNQLVNQPDKIIKVLENLGCEKINYNKHKGYITSTRPEDGADNALGNMVYIDRLLVHQNTRSYTGNIYTLVMDAKRVNFPKALELVAKWSGVRNIPNITIVPPFGGFFKKISRQQYEPELSMKQYSEDDLPSADCLSMKYIKDGVSAQIQEEFGVRYCQDEDAILTPIHDLQGGLVGCKARSNNPNCDMSHRFWAYLEYPKTLTLFGYVNNYNMIVQKKVVIVAEAEKSVMIAATWGLRVVVATAGHSISSTQAKYIKSLGADKIYIAYDEGIDEEEIQYEARKLLVDNQIYRNKVGYLYDENNTYLPKGSKLSPFDLGIDTFKKIKKNCTRWINGNKSE